jgi:hypothetical protein
MEEGRELAAVLDGSLDERLAKQILAAAEEAPARERIQAGVEAFVEAAEIDPEGTAAALAALRADATAQQRLERSLGLPEARATLALGAAIQLARAELAGPEPDLRRRSPELLRWLEGVW